MADTRNRISITVTDTELAAIEEVGTILGLRPTRVVYECVKYGLDGILEHAQRMQQQILIARQTRSQVDWTETAPKPAAQPKQSFQQKKVEARKAKKKKSR